MGTRRAGDCFLRCRDAPILSFLAPSWKSRTTWFRRPTLQRCFAASAYFHNDPSRPPVQSSDFNFAKKDRKDENILDVLGETFFARRRPSSSADMVQNSFQADIHRPEGESRSSRDGKIFGLMDLPGQNRGEATRPAATNPTSPSKPRNTATIRSRPSLGRSVNVSRAGVARAFQVLGYQLRDNNVKADQRIQRFHERPGLKKKRLKSERWRKRFRIAFKATLKQVHQMRKKGW